MEGEGDPFRSRPSPALRARQCAAEVALQRAAPELAAYCLAKDLLLVEDALLIAQGRVQVDRFAGGLRFNINQVWDLPAARARFGRYLAVAGEGPVVAVDRGPKFSPVERRRQRIQ